MVAVNHTGGFAVARQEGAGGLPLTADVIAVLPAEQVVVDDLEVFAGNQPLCTEVGEGEECSLR
jgi:hypothetical protein